MPDTAERWLNGLLWALGAADTETVERAAHAMVVIVARATEGLGNLMRSGNTTYNQW
jgi:hypothetical protein